MSDQILAARVSAPEWQVSDRLVDYPEAVAAMEARVEAMLAGRAGELVWLLEHPPLYTAGTSARDADLIWPDRFPVYRSRRGGEFTYHGPGQRVAYAMLDLNRRGRDVRAYVWRLEDLFVVNAGTVSSLRLRGNTRPCYNVIEIAGRKVDIWRRHPFHGQVKLVSFSLDTLDYAKFTGAIEDEVTART